MNRASHNLRRKPKGMPQRQKFILIMEGKNTEPDYFKAMRRHHGGALIDFDIIEAAGVPMTIAKKALEVKRSIRRGAKGQSWQLDDQVWVVFDHDTHPNLPDAIGLCNNAGIGIAFSNPCFELWLILHFEEFGRHDNHDAVQKHLKTIRPEYNPNAEKRLDCLPLMARIEDAEKRAMRQAKQRVDEGSQWGRPSTTVFQLTLAIREEALRKR